MAEGFERVGDGVGVLFGGFGERCLCVRERFLRGFEFGFGGGGFFGGLFEFESGLFESDAGGLGLRAGGPVFFGGCGEFLLGGLHLVGCGLLLEHGRLIGAGGLCDVLLVALEDVGGEVVGALVEAVFERFAYGVSGFITVEAVGEFFVGFLACADDFPVDGFAEAGHDWEEGDVALADLSSECHAPSFSLLVRVEASEGGAHMA